MQLSSSTYRTIYNKSQKPHNDLLLYVLDKIFHPINSRDSLVRKVC